MGSNYIRSCFLYKNFHTSQWAEKAKCFTSCLITFIFFIFIPYAAQISTINYFEVLISFILVGIIFYYFSLNSFLYNNDCTEIGLVAGNIDRVVNCIVAESLINDYFTCILLFIGLFMLMHNLTLKKSTVSIKDRIMIFIKNWKTTLVIVIGLLLLRIILGCFGIFLINTESFILFSVSVFVRIVFFQLLVAVTFSIYFKKIYYNLFSLNIFTVLFIGCIVYTYVFILFPIFSPTINLWYDNLYARSEDIYMNISNNLKISIKNYEKIFSLFIYEFNLGLESIVNLYEYISSIITDIIKNTVLPEPIYCSSPGAWDKLINTMDMPIGGSLVNSEQMGSPGEGSSLVNNYNRIRAFYPRHSKKNINYTLSDDDDRLKGRPKRACTIKGNIDDNLNKKDKQPQKDMSKEVSKVKGKKAWRIKNPDYINIRSVEAKKIYTKEYLESLEKRGIDRESALAISKIEITRGNKGAVPVWLQNLEGNKIKLYLSIEKCAEDLNVKPETIKSAIKINTTVQHKFKIRKVNFLDLELSEEQRKEIADTKQKGTVVSLIDSKGKVQVFNSILEASNYLGEYPSTVRRYVDKNVGFKKESEVYTLRKGNLLNEDLSREVDKSVKTRRVAITVTVTDSRGISQVFLSLRDASKKLGISVGNISENYLDKNVGVRKGSEFYTIRKGDVRDEHFSGMGEIFERVKKSNGTTIWATDSKGNTKIFKSINDASIFFKKSYKIFYSRYLDKDISILEKGESYKITRGNLLDKNRACSDHEGIIISASKGKYEMDFPSITDAAKYFNIDPKNIEPLIDRKGAFAIKGEFYSFRKK